MTISDCVRAPDTSRQAAANKTAHAVAEAKRALFDHAGTQRESEPGCSFALAWLAAALEATLDQPAESLAKAA